METKIGTVTALWKEYLLTASAMRCAMAMAGTIWEKER